MSETPLISVDYGVWQGCYGGCTLTRGLVVVYLPPQTARHHPHLYTREL